MIIYLKRWRMVLAIVMVVSFMAGACKAVTQPFAPRSTATQSSAPALTPQSTDTASPASPPDETLTPTSPATDACSLLPAPEVSQAVGALKGAPEAEVTAGQDQACGVTTQSGAQYDVSFSPPSFWFVFIPEYDLMLQRLLNVRTLSGLGDSAYVDEQDQSFTLMVIQKSQGVLIMRAAGGSLEQARALALVVFNHVALK